MITELKKIKHSQALNDEERWRAVQSRSADFNALFVYGVRSTRIYCRPTCPSRRPRREQVVFFAFPDAAELAGFRPCRRCSPHKNADLNPQVELVRRACRYIEEHSDGALTLADLSKRVGISPHHLQRTFKSVTGITPRRYAEACRSGRFKTELKKGMDVTTAIYEAGYGSSSRLYEKAPAQLGMTPKAYRKGGEGMRIGYTIVDSPLGRLLVAATERGICAVSLGASDDELKAFLKSEYPRAEIYQNESGLDNWVTALLAHLNGSRPHLALPLDVQATAFQWRVWEELRAIPYGDTRTYSEIARAIGRPSATRAVARACATNRAALVIPCHRVIREDKALGGYRWGLERKRALIDREKGNI